MIRGTNRAAPLNKAVRLINKINKVIGEAAQDDKKPCVFISHQQADTKEC